MPDRTGDFIHAKHVLCQLISSPNLVCVHSIKVLLYNIYKLKPIYYITLNQYSFQHLNDYSTYYIYYSINWTQSPTTYQNIIMLIIHSLEITHHFYPEIIYIYRYLHFRLYTKIIQTLIL